MPTPATDPARLEEAVPAADQGAGVRESLPDHAVADAARDGVDQNGPDAAAGTEE